MGGFAGLLGHAAAGFEGARQQDLQRQFADEQNRRAMAGELLGKIAGDENQHPDVRNAALQSYLGLSQAPPNKQYNFGKEIQPIFDLMAQRRAQTGQPQQSQSTVPQMTLGSQTLPATTTQFQGPPAPPEGLLASSSDVTSNMAQRKTALTKAEAGAEAKFPVMQIDPETNRTSEQFISGTGQPMGAPVQNAFNPAAMRGFASMIHPVMAAGPDGAPIPALQNKMTGEVYDQEGNVIPNAQVFAPSLVGRTSTEAMSSSGAITRKTTPSPRGAAGQTAKPVAKTSAVPAPPPELANGMPAGGGIAGVPPTAAPAPTPDQAAPAAISAPVEHPARTAAKRVTQGKGAVETSWANATDPLSQLGIRWATQGQKPAGGAMAERQVLGWMQKHQLQPALPVPPGMQQKIQESFVARNSAIDLIDDIMANKKVLDSLLSAGKIAVASNPDGSGVLQRTADLNDQEARVAGDFSQLIEHANLLRGPLGATGFRGREAWGALQAQRGKPLGDTRITSQVLTGMRQRLVGLNTADKMVLGGGGMNTAPATGGRVLSRATIDQAARDHGVDPAEAERQAREQGYDIQ